MIFNEEDAMRAALEGQEVAVYHDVTIERTIDISGDRAGMPNRRKRC